MLHTLSWDSGICKLYLNKTGGKRIVTRNKECLWWVHQQTGHSWVKNSEFDSKSKEASQNEMQRGKIKWIKTEHHPGAGKFSEDITHMSLVWQKEKKE